MKITKEKLKQLIKEELEVTLTNEEAGEVFGEEVQQELEEQDVGLNIEGFMSKIKKAFTPKPDTRTTLEKIAGHPDMRGVGPASGIIVDLINKHTTDEEKEEILILLNSVPGALAR